jgi:hypothetical protein
MTTFWTIMVITFGAGPLDGTVTGLPYKNSQECGDHIEVMQTQMEAQGLIVAMIQCKQINRISTSPRPQLRP